MSEWKECCVGDLCRYVCSGGTPKSSVSAYYNEGTIPWLNTKEIHGDQIFKTERFITELGLKNSSAKWIKANCVVVAMYGATAGQVAVVKIPVTTNQACCNLEIDSEKADYRFVYYSLRNSYRSLSGLANGGAQQNLNAQIIKDFQIVAPSLPTQRKIAAVLGALDDKIELNRKMNANLEAMAQAFFKSWFVDFEPFGGTMPEGWRMGTLSEVATVCRESWNPVKHSGEMVSHFSLPAFDQHRFPVLECADGIKSNKLKIDVSSLLVSKLNPEIKRIWRPTVVDDVSVASTEYVVIRANQIELRDWLFSILDSASFSSYLCSNVAGTTNSHQRVDPVDIMRFGIVIPTDTDAARFSMKMTTLYDKVYLNIVQSRTLAQLRDTLLPKLMSGELNVDDVKID